MELDAARNERPPAARGCGICKANPALSSRHQYRRPDPRSARLKPALSCAAARTHGALCALDPARPPLDLRFDPARVALYHERAFERGRRRADAAHARNRATGGAQNRTRHIALVHGRCSRYQYPARHAISCHDEGAVRRLRGAGIRRLQCRASARAALARPVEGAIFTEAIPFSETRDYVKKVMANMMYYAALFEGRAGSLQNRLGTVAPDIH